MLNRDRVFSLCNSAVLALVAAVTLFPLYYVFVVSFTAPEEFVRKSFILFPTRWSLESYRYLLASKIVLNSIGISAYLAVVGTAVSLLVNTALAYALSRKRMAGRRLILMLIVFTVIFNPGIILNYLLIRDLGLINSLWAVILPSIANGWYVLLMKGFFDGIPEGLDEAAAIDGCNDVMTWLRIVLPISLPALAAFGLFFAVGFWNQFFYALLYLNAPEKWPVQVLLQNLLNESSSANLDSAAATAPPPTETLKMTSVVITTTPILLVYPFLQKHFAKSAMVGSIKG